MISVLVAEDSPTARALIVQLLNDDPQLNVVGEARNGSEAVELTKQLKPDVVVMDIYMPVMNGFEASKRIMVETPTPIVIVSANIEFDQVSLSMQALQVGALAAIPKPVGPESTDFNKMSAYLLTAVKSMSQVKVVRHSSSHLNVAAYAQPQPETKSHLVLGRAKAKIICIATSVGGPPALSQLLAQLPGDFPVPVLIVQHLAKGFDHGLAQWLDRLSPLTVKLATQAEELCSGTVYIAPDNYHLGIVSASMIHLSESPAIGGFRPSGTFLFESMAKNFGPTGVAVILTGMGDDGVEGLVAVKKAGGRVIAQDEGSSVIYGMPGKAVARGLVDRTLPITDIAAQLLAFV